MRSDQAVMLLNGCYTHYAWSSKTFSSTTCLFIWMFGHLFFPLSPLLCLLPGFPLQFFFLSPDVLQVLHHTETGTAERKMQNGKAVLKNSPYLKIILSSGMGIARPANLWSSKTVFFNPQSCILLTKVVFLKKNMDCYMIQCLLQFVHTGRIVLWIVEYAWFCHDWCVRCTNEHPQSADVRCL